MRTKSMILIVIALGCGLIASIGISQVMDANRIDAPEPVETRKILVAVKEIDLGQLMTPKMVKIEEWPKERIPEGAVGSLKRIENKRTLARLFPGEPVMSGKMIDKDKYHDPTMQIPQGFRVVSVSVTSSVAVANLIKPGDRVDVVVFLKGGKYGIKQTTTRTILRDIKVFAVNTHIRRSQEEDGVIRAKNVSLLVRPEQVQKVMLASELGKIRLSLRRSDEESSDEPDDTLVRDLFGNDDDSDFKTAEVSKPAESGGITDFLKGMQAAPPVGVDMTDGWEMTILSAGGNAVTYRWDDKSKMPVSDSQSYSTSDPGVDGEAGATPDDSASDPTAEFNGESPADWLDANPLDALN